VLACDAICSVGSSHACGGLIIRFSFSQATGVCTAVQQWQRAKT